jgi:hypothetical protein
MRMLNAALSAAMVVLISACATVGPGEVPSGLSEAPPEKTGLVFGSVGVGGPTPFQTQGLRYRAMGSSENALIFFRKGGLMDTPVDFSEGAARGSVFAMRLPPGDYELYNVLFFVNRAQFGSTTFTAKGNFSIPFKVVEGTATYLGEFLTYPVTGKSIFGGRVPSGGYFVVSNKLDRDFSILARKGFPIPRERVSDATVDPRLARSPMLQEKPLPPEGAVQPAAAEAARQ